MEKPSDDSGSFKYVTTKASQNTQEKVNSFLVQKPVKTHIVTHLQQGEVHGNLEVQGKDLDEEYTIQNFINIARQGDISPRQIEKGKSTGKGRKKQQKDTHIL